MASLRELSYPVRGNRVLPGGARRTVAVVRYPADDVQGDGHLVAFQHDAPKRQVVAFLEAVARGARPPVIDGGFGRQRP